MKRRLKNPSIEREAFSGSLISHKEYQDQVELRLGNSSSLNPNQYNQIASKMTVVLIKL